jgi:hypothetical protein
MTLNSYVLLFAAAAANDENYQRMCS